MGGSKYKEKSDSVGGNNIKLSKQEMRQRSYLEKVKRRRSDVIKCVLAGIIVAAGLWGFYWQSSWPVYLRALFPIVAIGVALSIVLLWCDLGQRLLRYIKDSIAEVRKVVWPTRAETWKGTLFVLVFTFIMTVFLWVVDSILAWLFLLNA